MNGSVLVIWGLAAVAGVLVLRKGTGPARAALRDTWRSLTNVVPLLAVALPAASLLAELIPNEVAASLMGPETGVAGIVFAGIIGGLIPGGPFVSFPLVLTFWVSGAGTPQMVALVSGWAVLGFHRVIQFEWPLLGGRFVLLRMASGIAMPILSGLIAWALLPLFPGVRP